VIPSSPGLYVAGIPFLHSFASMFIGGVGRDAERVVRHIVGERASELRRGPQQALAAAAAS
jgi:putative flavoprotein involved in K+ transport